MDEPKPMRSIHGVVRDYSDQPFAGVLVEVYDHPEIGLQNTNYGRPGQKRIVACITDETGRFSLKVPPGHYEVRFSKDLGWDVTSIPVRVAKFAFPWRKNMTALLHIGE